jgi:hypothetical protein
MYLSTLKYDLENTSWHYFTEKNQLQLINQLTIYFCWNLDDDISVHLVNFLDC